MSGRDLFSDMDVVVEDQGIHGRALIDAGRRAGDREPHSKQHASLQPGGAAPGVVEDRTSIDYFAKLQRMHYEAGLKSSREYHANMAKAKAAAQEGIDRAVAHADRDVPGWSDVAFEFIRLHAMQNRGKRFTGYEIVQASVARGIVQPESAKAWGGPIQRAARGGIIRKVGTTPDPNPERHGSDVPLWEAV